MSPRRVKVYILEASFLKRVVDKQNWVEKKKKEKRGRKTGLVVHHVALLDMERTSLPGPWFCLTVMDKEG
jgi:hypothetical protein